MTARTDEIRKRLEAAEPVNMSRFDGDMFDLIANAPEDIRYLLARVEKLEGLLKRVGDETYHHGQRTFGSCDCGAEKLYVDINGALGEP